MKQHENVPLLDPHRDNARTNATAAEPNATPTALEPAERTSAAPSPVLAAGTAQTIEVAKRIDQLTERFSPPMLQISTNLQPM